MTAKPPESVTLYFDTRGVYFGVEGAKPAEGATVFIRADVHERVVAELEEQKKWRAIVATEAKDLGDQVDTLRAKLEAQQAEIEEVDRLTRENMWLRRDEKSARTALEHVAAQVHDQANELHERVVADLRAADRDRARLVATSLDLEAECLALREQLAGVAEEAAKGMRVRDALREECERLREQIVVQAANLVHRP